MSRFPVRVVLLIAVGALAFSACGSSGDDDSATAGQAESVECPVGAIEEAGGGPVEIDFWHAMIEQNAVVLEEMTDQFNASQDGVTVNLVFQGDYEETLEKYQTAVGGDPADLPAVIQLEDTATQTMIDSGTVLPAQQCISATDYDTSDYIEKTLAFYTVRDELWPMPWNVSNLLLYYNEQAFEQAGLDPADTPSTLEEIREASEAIVDSGAAEAGFALKLDPWWLEQLTASVGETFVNNENGREARATEVTFENDAGLEVYEWMQGMVDDGLAINTGSPKGNFENLLSIGAGTAAMTMDTSASLGTIQSVLGTGQFPDVTLGVGPRASLVEQEPNAVVAGGALYMIDLVPPEQQEAAWEYVTWLNEPEQQATWAIGTGYIPIRESAAELPEIQELWASQPEFQVAYDQLVSGELTPATEGPVIGPYRGIRDIVINSFEAMLGEGKPPEQALADAASQANEALETYNQTAG